VRKRAFGNQLIKLLKSIMPGPRILRRLTIRS
jgi:hypothetical protein